MKFVYFLLLASHAVTSENENNYYVIQMPEVETTVAPLTRKEPLQVYWNVPTMQCASKKIVFEKLFEKFGIIQNKGDQFRGEKIAILYDPGYFPALFRNETSGKLRYRNGGVPQAGDLNLHLKIFRSVLDQSIPDHNFKGIGVIDFESWRPILRQNFGDTLPYKAISYELERSKHWWWPQAWIHHEAKLLFESAATKFMQQTIALAKQMRPGARWGYYGFPYCFNMAANNLNEDCQKNVRTENELIDWLWAESSGLFPSVYSSKELTTEQLIKLISGRVREAARVRGRDTPILPYFWFRYRDGGFLRKVDLNSALKTFENSAAAGFIVWGSSNDVNTVEKCTELHNYIENTFGPAIALYTKRKYNANTEPPKLNMDNYKNNTVKDEAVTENLLSLPSDEDLSTDAFITFEHILSQYASTQKTPESINMPQRNHSYVDPQETLLKQLNESLIDNLLLKSFLEKNTTTPKSDLISKSERLAEDVKRNYPTQSAFTKTPAEKTTVGSQPTFYDSTIRNKTSIRKKPTNIVRHTPESNTVTSLPMFIKVKPLRRNKLTRSNITRIYELPIELDQLPNSDLKYVTHSGAPAAYERANHINYIVPASAPLHVVRRKNHSNDLQWIDTEFDEFEFQTSTYPVQHLTKLTEDKGKHKTEHERVLAISNNKENDTQTAPKAQPNSNSSNNVDTRYRSNYSNNYEASTSKAITVTVFWKQIENTEYIKPNLKEDVTMADLSENKVDLPTINITSHLGSSIDPINESYLRTTTPAERVIPMPTSSNVDDNVKLEESKELNMTNTTEKSNDTPTTKVTSDIITSYHLATGLQWTETTIPYEDYHKTSTQLVSFPPVPLLSEDKNSQPELTADSVSNTTEKYNREPAKTVTSDTNNDANNEKNFEVSDLAAASLFLKESKENNTRGEIKDNSETNITNELETSKGPPYEIEYETTTLTTIVNWGYLVSKDKENETRKHTEQMTNPTETNIVQTTKNVSTVVAGYHLGTGLEWMEPTMRMPNNLTSSDQPVTVTSLPNLIKSKENMKAEDSKSQRNSTDEPVITSTNDIKAMNVSGHAHNIEIQTVTPLATLSDEMISGAPPQIKESTDYTTEKNTDPPTTTITTTTVIETTKGITTIPMANNENNSTLPTVTLQPTLSGNEETPKQEKSVSVTTSNIIEQNIPQSTTDISTPNKLLTVDLRRPGRKRTNSTNRPTVSFSIKLRKKEWKSKDNMKKGRPFRRKGLVRKPQGNTTATNNSTAQSHFETTHFKTVNLKEDKTELNTELGVSKDEQKIHVTQNYDISQHPSTKIDTMEITTVDPVNFKTNNNPSKTVNNLTELTKTIKNQGEELSQIGTKEKIILARTPDFTNHLNMSSHSSQEHKIENSINSPTTNKEHLMTNDINALDKSYLPGVTIEWMETTTNNLNKSIDHIETVRYLSESRAEQEMKLSTIEPTKQTSIQTVATDTSNLKTHNNSRYATELYLSDSIRIIKEQNDREPINTTNKLIPVATEEHSFVSTTDSPTLFTLTNVIIVSDKPGLKSTQATEFNKETATTTGRNYLVTLYHSGPLEWMEPNLTYPDSVETNTQTDRQTVVSLLNKVNDSEKVGSGKMTERITPAAKVTPSLLTVSDLQTNTRGTEKTETTKNTFETTTHSQIVTLTTDVKNLIRSENKEFSNGNDTRKIIDSTVNIKNPSDIINNVDLIRKDEGEVQYKIETSMKTNILSNPEYKDDANSNDILVADEIENDITLHEKVTTYSTNIIDISDIQPKRKERTSTENYKKYVESTDDTNLTTDRVEPKIDTSLLVKEKSKGTSVFNKLFKDYSSTETHEKYVPDSVGGLEQTVYSDLGLQMLSKDDERPELKNDFTLIQSEDYNGFNKDPNTKGTSSEENDVTEAPNSVENVFSNVGLHLLVDERYEPKYDDNIRTSPKIKPKKHKIEFNMTKEKVHNNSDSEADLHLLDKKTHKHLKHGSHFIQVNIEPKQEQFEVNDDVFYDDDRDRIMDTPPVFRGHAKRSHANR